MVSYFPPQPFSRSRESYHSNIRIPVDQVPQVGHFLVQVVLPDLPYPAFRLAPCRVLNKNIVALLLLRVLNVLNMLGWLYVLRVLLLVLLLVLLRLMLGLVLLLPDLLLRLLYGLLLLELLLVPGVREAHTRRVACQPRVSSNVESGGSIEAACQT